LDITLALEISIEPPNSSAIIRAPEELRKFRALAATPGAIASIAFGERAAGGRQCFRVFVRGSAKLHEWQTAEALLPDDNCGTSIKR
jgi:hypothetical protein